jgi:hypothetical protein
MIHRQVGRFFLFACFAFAAQSLAQDTIAPKIEVMGKAAMVEGQFVKGNYDYTSAQSANVPYIREALPYRPWINNEYAEIGLKTTLTPYFSGIVAPQIKLWNDTWDWTSQGQDPGPNNPFIQHMTISLANAEGIFTFGNKDALAFTIEAGVFPFKYDHDTKNLGEYLFRTGETPAYIQTSFDDAYATLTGMRFNAAMAGLSLDVLLTQEEQILPINDWSLSILASYKVSNVLDIGAGVMFDRLIPVQPKKAEQPTAQKLQNTYYSSNGNLDTLSWGGTKLMARVSFDPKGLLPFGLTNKLGKEDGKIYAEVAVLGLKSFTAYKKSITGADTSLVVDSNMNFYSDINQRMPITVGFNIPTFQLLDYLSVEVEYFGWPYSPSLYNYENQLYTLPQPIIPTTPLGQAILYTKNNYVKWSVNARKTLWGNFSIIGQIADDHTRHDAFYSPNADPEEVFIDHGSWGWWLKLQYSL